MNQINEAAFSIAGPSFACRAPASDGNTRQDTGNAAPVAAAVEQQARVAILLATYHGQQFLAEQLDSYSAQTHANWQLWVSDDASGDNTPTILAEYQRRWGSRLQISSGPAAGFAANFLALACDPRVEADFYAYSDQDDIWEADKLSRALAWLQEVPQDTPALYFSRTLLVDEQNREIGLSPLFSRPPSFANALVQNIGGGNTMVFNQAARELLLAAGPHVEIVSHDWWTYMLVSGCGGQVRYDPQPTIRYRQHEQNLVGHNSGLQARWKRVRMLMRGRYRKWNDLNTRALQTMAPRLTPENQAIFRRFCEARQAGAVGRLTGLLRSGVYRQSTLDNLALAIASLLGKA